MDSFRERVEKLKAGFKMAPTSAASNGALHPGAEVSASSAGSAADAAQCSWPEQAKLLFKRSWCVTSHVLHPPNGSPDVETEACSVQRGPPVSRRVKIAAADAMHCMWAMQATD